MARKSTGTRLRFKVFQRDGFTCQYCGAKPGSEDVILQVDHIVPVSKGGNNDIENLITACRKCNAGKTDRSLSDITPSISKNIEEITEKYEQLKGFYEYQQKSDKLKQKMLSSLDVYWYDLFDVSLDTKERISVKQFMKIFSIEEIKDAMDLSTKVKHPHYAFKYMCGVLHNKRKEREDAEQDREWERMRSDPNYKEVTVEEIDEFLNIFEKGKKKD